jgi:hypothetical protein
MLDLNDPKWKEFEGGYRIRYDASVPLKKLEKATKKEEVSHILAELWDELHHQGDVGIASYYSVPHLIRIVKTSQTLAPDILNLIITIEIERHRNNPSIPSDLFNDYDQAIKDLGGIGKSIINVDWDLQLASTALAAIALSKGQVDLARAIVILEDQGTLDELLEQY